MTLSVFAKYAPQAYPFTFTGSLHIPCIAGGTPSDPKVAEGYIKSKIAAPDDLIRQSVAELMVERGVTADEAVGEVALNKLNGFKRDEHGLYIEGRQLKSAIKEAANVRWPNGRWSIDKNGKALLRLKVDSTTVSGKATRNWFAEHVFVQEDRLYLGTHEASGINQRFIATWRGTGIQYEEYVLDAKVDFTLAADCELADEMWALLWLTGEQQGIGATRSQGFGRYAVTRWERLKSAPAKTSAEVLRAEMDAVAAELGTRPDATRND